MRRAVLLLLLLAATGGCMRFSSAVRGTPLERTMLVTGYCKCGACCGWRRTWYGRPVYASGPRAGERKTVGITASGVKAHRGTIAADTSRYPFGTTMYIEGYGYGRVEDRGGAITGDHIDLFFSSHADALAWGRRTLKVKVWLPAAPR